MMASENTSEAIDWNVAAEKLCAAMDHRAAQLAKRASEHLYEDFLYSVQEYLRDNTEFNLSSELVGKDAEIARLRAGRGDMLAALLSAEMACAELCQGQDPGNQCWITLAEVRAAIAKAEGRSNG